MLALHFLTDFCESWFLWWLLPFLLGLLLGWAIWAKWAKRARELEDEVASLKVKISDLEEKLEACGRDKKHFQDALSISENRLRDLKLKISELDSEIEQLNSNLSADESDGSGADAGEDDGEEDMRNNLSAGNTAGTLGFTDDHSSHSGTEGEGGDNDGSEAGSDYDQEETSEHEDDDSHQVENGEGSDQEDTGGVEHGLGDDYGDDRFKGQGDDSSNDHRSGDDQDINKIASSLAGTTIPEPSSTTSFTGGGKYDKLQEDNLQILEGVGPKMESILHENGVNSWSGLASMSTGELQSILGKYGDRYRIIDPSGWPRQAAYASRGDWDGLIAFQKEDGSASKAEKVMIKLGIIKAWKKDDLKAIEGIGPKIEQLMHNAGITTWRQMAEASVGQLNSILEEAGKRYQLADPSTWPQQAGLAADERWEDLERLQDHLKGGRNPS
ncbi:MAG: hypothetical protein KJO29_14010 [Bacteroidia bacterium]|nr:hypothetical protein [Bacteroidia bacterium]